MSHLTICTRRRHGGWKEEESEARKGRKNETEDDSFERGRNFSCKQPGTVILHSGLERR